MRQSEKERSVTAVEKYIEKNGNGVKKVDKRGGGGGSKMLTMQLCVNEKKT